MVVWKYTLTGLREDDLEMPIGAKILSVVMQRGIPCLYVIVDPGCTAREKRTIRRFGTNHHMKDVERLSYIGSLQHGDTVSWHYFEEIR
jgi:hypothetical protein